MKVRFAFSLLVGLGALAVPVYAGAGDDLPEIAAQRVAGKRLRRVKRCYRQVLDVYPERYGAVTVGLRVSPEGETRSTEIVLSSLAEPEAEGCIAEAFEGLTFPEPAGERLVKVTLFLHTDETPEEVVRRTREALQGPTEAPRPRRRDARRPGSR